MLVLGLDGAGKSTLLQHMNSGDSASASKPTNGFSVISIQNEGVALNIWEGKLFYFFCFYCCVLQFGGKLLLCTGHLDGCFLASDIYDGKCYFTSHVEDCYLHQTFRRVNL